MYKIDPGLGLLVPNRSFSRSFRQFIRQKSGGAVEPGTGVPVEGSDAPERETTRLSVRSMTQVAQPAYILSLIF